VLCALVVFLQAKLLSRLDLDAFDFIAFVFDEGFIPAPRAVNSLVGLSA
jgi:hypothetical protein